MGLVFFLRWLELSRTVEFSSSSLFCFQGVLQSAILLCMILVTIPTTRLTPLVCVFCCCSPASLSLTLPIPLSSIQFYLPRVIRPARQTDTSFEERCWARSNPTTRSTPTCLSKIFLRLAYRTLRTVLYEYCQTLTYATSTPTNFTLPFLPSSALLPLSSLFSFPPPSLDQARNLPSLSISPSPLPEFVLSSSLGFGPYNIRVGPLPNCFNPPFHIPSVDI